MDAAQTQRRWHMPALAAVLILLAAPGLPTSALGSDASTLEKVEGQAVTAACENPLPTVVPVCQAWVTTHFERPLDVENLPFANGVGQQPYDMVLSPDGETAYITGLANPQDSGPALAVVAVETSTGRTLWERTTTGPAPGPAAGYAIAMAPHGGVVYAAGELPTASGDRDAAVLALDAEDGSTLWQFAYDTPDHLTDFAAEVEAFPDGDRVAVAIASSTATSRLDRVTVVLDADTGQVQWQHRHAQPGDLSSTTADLVVSPHGERLYSVGTITTNSTWADWYAVAYDTTTGDVLWTAQYDGIGSLDTAKQGAMTPDGSRLLVAGSSPGPGSGMDAVVIAYDATTGETWWTSRYDGQGNGNDILGSLLLSPDGAIAYIGATSVAADGFDGAIVAIRVLDGQVIWDAVYSGIVPDSREGVGPNGISPDGRTLYAAGTSEGIRAPLGTERDIVVVALNATNGHILWSSRYNGPGWEGDSHVSSALAPTGDRIIVTGKSQNADNNLHWITMAYETPPPLGDVPQPP